MFFRLLKQDARATGRIMIVLYAAVLVLAAATRLMAEFFDDNVGSILIMIFSRLLTVLFVVAVVACIVMTFVLMLIRFYRNFLTDEGYLMFTLPVTKGQLIWSKLLVSVFWAVVSGLVGILASFILSVGTDAQDVLFGLDLSRFFEPFTTGQSVVIVLVIVAAVLLYLAYTYLRCYAAMAVGQSFGNHKLLLSVVFYIIFGIAESIVLVTLLSNVLTESNIINALEAASAEPFAAVMSTIGRFDVTYLILCTVYFVITYLFFRKRLNLQ